MPLYDFKCHDCNHQFEHLALKAPKEPLELACPMCDSKKTQKLLSAPNVQFKGSGFYVTDSKKKPQPKKAEKK